MRGTPLLVCLLLLAGCNDAPATDDVVTVRSAPPSEVATDEPMVRLAAGSLAGTVVDPLVRPIADVEVRIPGLDRSTTTDEEGRFGLSDLPEGHLYLKADHPEHRPAATEVQIVRGDITKVRLVLEQESREPYMTMQESAGYAEFAGDPVTAWSSMFCEACTFQATLEPGYDAVVIEAASDRPPSADPTGFTDSWRFVHGISVDGSSASYAWTPDPWRLELTNETLGGGQYLTLQLEPREPLVPASAVSFEVWIAAFYNGAPPEEWSVLEGRP